MPSHNTLALYVVVVPPNIVHSMGLDPAEIPQVQLLRLMIFRRLDLAKREENHARCLHPHQ